MLPPAHRLTRSIDFASTMRHGRRTRRGELVVHQLLDDSARVPRVGLVVGRTVGGSVVRHRVSRRLRALMAARLTTLPAGSATVIRALPGADAADSARLGRDLDQALARLAPSSPAAS